MHALSLLATALPADPQWCARGANGSVGAPRDALRAAVCCGLHAALAAATRPPLPPTRPPPARLRVAEGEQGASQRRDAAPPLAPATAESEPATPLLTAPPASGPLSARRARVVARRGGVRLHPRRLQPTPLSLLGPLARVPRRVLARRHGLHRRPRRVRRRLATHAKAEPVEASAPASSPTAAAARIASRGPAARRSSPSSS